MPFYFTSLSLFQIDLNCVETYYFLQCSRLKINKHFDAMGIQYLDTEVLTYSVEQLLSVDLTTKLLVMK